MASPDLQIYEIVYPLASFMLQHLASNDRSGGHINLSENIEKKRQIIPLDKQRLFFSNGGVSV